MTEPSIDFCRTRSGSQVAFASAGAGPPLVLTPGWVSHVERSWRHPMSASALARLAASHRVIWYDRLGCGLSDRTGFTPSLDNDVEQLEAVVDAAGVARPTLIGHSTGGPTVARFAARHPQRVRRLVLHSTFARGGALVSDSTHAALTALARSDWSLGARTLATLFVPNGSHSELEWCTELQQTTTTGDVAADLLDAIRRFDVREDLARIRAPTLVLTHRDDPTVHADHAREVAALVPDAELCVLEGHEHAPFLRDAGSTVEAITHFVAGRPAESNPPGPEQRPLSTREIDVLRLIGEGHTNRSIAVLLDVTVSTVERHITSMYRKLGIRGRADAARHAVALGLVQVPEPDE